MAGKSSCPNEDKSSDYYIVASGALRILLKQKQINAREFTVLMLIRHFSLQEQGCFASNRYLANEIGCSVDQFKHHLIRLRRMGFIQNSYKNTTRYLIYTIDENSPQESNPDMNQPNSPRAKNNTPCEKQHGGVRKTTRGACEKQHGGRAKKHPHNKQPLIEEKIAENNISEKSPRKARGSVSGGRCASPKNTPNKTNFILTQFDRISGARLYAILAENDSDLIHGKTKTRKDTLAKVISKLRVDRNKSESEITEFLDWYEKAFDDEYVPRYRKSDDLFSKWDQFSGAKKRHSAKAEKKVDYADMDRDDPRFVAYYKKCRKIYGWIVKHGLHEPYGNSYVMESDIQKACEALKIDYNSINPDDIHE